MKVDLDTVLKKTNRYYAREKGRDTEDAKPVPSEQIRALAEALVEEINAALDTIKPVTITPAPGAWTTWVPSI